MIQQDCIVITTRSHSNILDLIILIINLTIWISSECFDCVLRKLCIGMPAIVVETASKNSNIDYKMFLINNIILTMTIEEAKLLFDRHHLWTYYASSINGFKTSKKNARDSFFNL